jgi:hypothetical protein
LDSLTQALRGSAHLPKPALARLQSALVVGAGGTLGSAVLAEALAGGRFQRVAAVVAGPLTSAMRGFHALPLHALDEPGPLDIELAFIVFERQRRSNGRDDAFFQPEVASLPAIAAALHARGVRRLLVIVPHAPSLLPQALKAGFASLDEGAVAALGFEQLVLARPSQDAAAVLTGNALARFAAWWLSQLRWVVPQREQPVRALTLAALVVQLARLLPQARPATRVLPQELLSQAAQGEAEALLAAWLAQ